MKRIFALLKLTVSKMRNYVSPVFLLLLAVSFTLWYIAKLNYSYTTDLTVDVHIDGEHINVPCVVEAKGSTLFGYKLSGAPDVEVSLSELKYEMLDLPTTAEGVVDSTAVQKIRIYTSAMQHALSKKFSDLKVVSVGRFEDIKLPKK